MFSLNKANVMQDFTYDIIKSNLYRWDVDISKGLVLNKRVSTHGGYPQIFIKTRYVKVHQIIAVLLWDKDCVGKQVNHIDGNKTNNMPSNLELVTPAENNKHAYMLGLQYPKLGSKNGSSKLVEADVIEIRKLLDQGINGVEIGKRYGVTKHTISLIRNKKIWKHI